MEHKNAETSTIIRVLHEVVKKSQRTRAVLASRTIYSDPDVAKLVDLMGEAEKLAYLLIGRQMRGELDDLIGEDD